MTFISGAFQATFGGLPLGLTEDGFEVTTARMQEEIRADHYKGLLDAIYQGIEMTIRAVFLEADQPGLQRLLWPYNYDNDVTAYEDGDNGKVAAGSGQLISSWALPLIMTPCAGTTAATKGKHNLGANTSTALTNITFPRVVLAPESQSIRYSASLRKIPVTMTVLPHSCWSASSLTGSYAVPICDGYFVYYGYDVVGAAYCA
jgi:hypothetical protein